MFLHLFKFMQSALRPNLVECLVIVMILHNGYLYILKILLKMNVWLVYLQEDLSGVPLKYSYFQGILLQPLAYALAIYDVRAVKTVITRLRAQCFTLVKFLIYLNNFLVHQFKRPVSIKFNKYENFKLSFHNQLSG